MELELKNNRIYKLVKPLEVINKKDLLDPPILHSTEAGVVIKGIRCKGKLIYDEGYDEQGEIRFVGQYLRNGSLVNMFEDFSLWTNTLQGLYYSFQ